MNSVFLFNRTFRRLAILATFVHSNATNFSTPPAAEGLPEGSISVQARAGQYRPQRTYVIPPQVSEDPSPSSVRSVNLKTYPYSTGKTTAVTPQLADEISTDPPEGSRNLQIPLAQYRPQRNLVVIPQIADEVAEAEALPEGSRSFQITLAQYRAQLTSSRGVPVADFVAPVEDLPEGSRNLQIPIGQYRPHRSAFNNGVLESAVPEADQCLTLAVEFENRSDRTFTKFFTDIDGAAEPTNDLPEGSRNLQIPIGQYPRLVLIITNGATSEAAEQPPETTEENHHRISVYSKTYPYVRPPVRIVPKTEDQLPEADASLQIVTEFENRSNLTFIRFQKPDEPAPVEADELHKDVRSVNLFSPPYRGKTTTVSQQPAELEVQDLPEGSTSVQARAGQYRPQRTLTLSPAVAEIVPPVEAPELHKGIRSVYTPIRPYRGKTVVVQPQIATDFSGDQEIILFVEFENRSHLSRFIFRQPDEAVVVEAPELHEGIKSVNLYTRPYRSHVFIQTPPIPALVVIEADELHNGIRSVYTPIRPYKGQTKTVSRQPTEIDELIQGRRSVTLKTYPYGGKTVVRQPQTRESDELSASRRSVTIPPEPYRGKTTTVSRQPAEINELFTSTRHVQKYTRPYVNTTYFKQRQPAELPPLPEGDQVNAVKVQYPKYDPRQSYFTIGNADLSLPSTDVALPHINCPSLISTTPHKGIVSTTPEKGITSTTAHRGIEKLC